MQNRNEDYFPHGYEEIIVLIEICAQMFYNSIFKHFDREPEEIQKTFVVPAVMKNNKIWVQSFAKWNFDCLPSDDYLFSFDPDLYMSHKFGTGNVIELANEKLGGCSRDGESVIREEFKEDMEIVKDDTYWIKIGDRILFKIGETRQCKGCEFIEQSVVEHYMRGHHSFSDKLDGPRPVNVVRIIKII